MNPSPDARTIARMSISDSPWIEIFAEGTWHGVAYGRADLDLMVENFNRDQNEISPPMVVGHDDAQELLKESGLPAAGYLAALKRLGKKIVAKFREVPEVIRDCVARGAYSRCSVEIHPNFEGNGLTIRRVALLGGELPEVSSLEEIRDLATADDATQCGIFHFSAKEISMGETITKIKTEKTVSPAPVEPAPLPATDLQEEPDQAGSDVAQLAQAVADLQAMVQSVMERLDALEGGGEVQLAEHEDDEEDEELSASPAPAPDTSKIAELSARVEKMTADAHGRDVDTLRTELIQARKITPAAYDSMRNTLVKMSSADFGTARDELRGAPAATGELGRVESANGKLAKPEPESESEEARILKFRAEYDAETDEGFKNACGGRKAYVDMKLASRDDGSLNYSQQEE